MSAQNGGSVAPPNGAVPIEKAERNDPALRSWPGKRLFDIVLVVCSTPLSLPLAGVIALLIKLDSRGPALHWSARVGRFNHIFQMPKFRTMRTDTPQLPTHLMKDPALYLTRLGGFLRASSLDELPQLWSVLKGDLTLVGPRPALFNQDDLVQLRTAAGVHKLVPGITGWAQINGRDDLSIPVKVGFDTEYLHRRGFWFDLKILLRTFLKVGRAEGIHH